MMTSCTTFRAYLFAQHHTTSTIKSYQFIISKYLAEHPNADTYNYREVFEYVKSYIFRFSQRPNMALIQAALKKYYDYLIHIGKLENHPCRGLFLKQRSKPLIHQDLFTFSELERLLHRTERYSMLKYRNKVLVSLLIYQGVTLNELIRIKMKHIDLDDESIMIKRTKTTNSRRLLLHHNQIDFIEKYLKMRIMIHNTKPSIENDYLLLNKLGNPITTDDSQYIIETFKFLYPERKLSPQTIRQSVIANWINEKHIPLEQVQLLAGHRWLSSTQRYKQADIAKQVELINGFHPVF